MRETGLSTENYKLEVFVPTAAEYDLTVSTNQAALLTALKAVTTTTLENAARQIGRTVGSSTGVYYFYELIDDQPSGTEPDVVEPDDYDSVTNDRRWRLVHRMGLGQTELTITEFLEVGLHFLPNGEEIPDQVEIYGASDTNNKVTLTSTMNHFDAPPKINNSNKLYYNILKYDSSGGSTPTLTHSSEWSENNGNTRRIQEKRKDWLTRLTKQGRKILNGAITYDTEVSPLHILRVPDDDNRRYLITGGSWDLRMNRISGTKTELGSDTAPTSSAVDSSVDSDEVV
jgi:hypothetical protein